MTISRWVVPCNFIEENGSAKPIIFDLTIHLKTMLLNEVWNQKYSYGYSEGLKKTTPDDIRSATIKVFPRFISGEVGNSIKYRLTIPSFFVMSAVFPEQNF